MLLCFSKTSLMAGLIVSGSSLYHDACEDSGHIVPVNANIAKKNVQIAQAYMW